jgi:hypothetical protein
VVGPFNRAVLAHIRSHPQQLPRQRMAGASVGENCKKRRVLRNENLIPTLKKRNSNKRLRVMALSANQLIARAEEIRAVGEALSDVSLRRLLIRIAESYKRMADNFPGPGMVPIMAGLFQDVVLALVQDVMLALRLIDRQDSRTELIAKKLTELALSGESDLDVLMQLTLGDVHRRPH